MTEDWAPWCIECIAKDEDPAPWCDCRDDEQCNGPCRKRAHFPSCCPLKTRAERD